MLEGLIKLLFGSQHERDLKALLPVLHSVNEKEIWAAALPPEEFPKMTETFRERFASGESLESLLPEAFALAREAAVAHKGSVKAENARPGLLVTVTLPVSAVQALMP